MLRFPEMSGLFLFSNLRKVIGNIYNSVRDKRMHNREYNATDRSERRSGAKRIQPGEIQDQRRKKHVQILGRRITGSNGPG